MIATHSNLTTCLVLTATLLGFACFYATRVQFFNEQNAVFEKEQVMSMSQLEARDQMHEVVAEK